MSRSTKTYLALVLFLVAVKILFLAFPAKFPLADQEGAFSWLTITTVSVLGFLGLLLTRKAGFPDFWDGSVSHRQRFLIPAVVGLVYGVVTILFDLRNPAPVHLSLPSSIPFYAYGATLLEILLRLFAVTFLVWLISNLILRGKWQAQVFWLAAVIAALYEPLPHLTNAFHTRGMLAALGVLVAAPLFAGNIVAAYLYRKYGFLAALTMRLSFYLLWHIIYGGLLSVAK
ncbi:MAG: hypothetical protein WAM70_04875 [Pyrinomonadaceae bacterium]